MATRSLGVHGQVISLNQDLAAGQMLFFSNTVYFSAAEAWACSRILGVYIVILLLGFVLSGTMYFPTADTQGLPGCMAKQQAHLHHSLDLLRCPFLFSVSLRAGTFHATQ